MLKSQNLVIALGRNVKRLRLSQGLSQRELAEKSTVPRTNISLIESGLLDCRLSTLEKLCWGLIVPVSELTKEA